MRLAFTMLALMGAMFAISACAAAAEMRADVVAGFCDAGEDWTAIAPPADAQAFRDALANDMEYASDRQMPAYWFTRADGEVRLCHTALARAEYTHPRWRACDTRIATWWDFHRTESGPRTNGAQERICLT